MNAPSPRPVVRARSSRRAFTLIELLTVIAIIGILAAILIPTVGAVRDSARSAQCKSNLRQLGMELIQYSHENRGRTPVRQNPDPDNPGGELISWWQLVQKRLGLRFPQEGVDNLFLCPLAYKTFTVAPRRTYALNLAGGGEQDPVLLLRLSAPSLSILLVESRQTGSTSDGLSVVGFGSIERQELNWHHKGETMNVAMADGSVRTLQRNLPEFPDLLRNIRR
jgi:prepilin-type N-terminal cleavage/methylation domain